MADKLTDKPVVGIDLGTTNSCVGIWQKGEVMILPNKWKENTTPSCVAFTQNGIVVGKSALAQKTRNPANTIFEAKRTIGQNYKDIVKVIKHMPFAMTEEIHPKYSVQVEGIPKFLSPAEISAIVLRQLKEDAENHLKKEVKDVVVSVPAYFNESQRESTKAAGKIAGLNILKMIPEPVAAALAFGFSSGDEESIEEENILVYDLGGGTFDTAIVTINFALGMYHVRATNGNTRLGGAKFLELLVNLYINKLQDMAINIEFSNEELSIIRAECEKAKIALSHIAETEIILANIAIKIKRDEYEKVIEPYIQKTMICVTNALKDANMDKADINKIVLVGGGSSTPLVKSTIERFFGKSVCNNIDPMEAVGFGACVQAAVLAGKPDVPSMYVRNVIPLTIGVITLNKSCAPFIKRNSPYPIMKKLMGRTCKDNQTKAKITLVEGEHLAAKDNKKLGSFVLEGLSKSAKGNELVEISIKINDDATISATATDQRTQQQAKIEIKRQSQFCESDISRMADNIAKLRKGIDTYDLPNDLPTLVFKTVKELSDEGISSKRIKVEQSEIPDEICPIYGDIGGERPNIDAVIELTD